MKLSEAIRLGGMMRPQAFGTFYDKEMDGVCALGAALDACGQLNKEDPISGRQNEFLRLHWPIVKELPQCPVCGRRNPWELEMKIAHLNDSHRWTREQIADWVETVERAQEMEIETAPVSAQEHAVELGAQR